MKEITIGTDKYKIHHNAGIATQILQKIVQWMEDPRHYAATCGEGVWQDDDCQTDCIPLIVDIIDNVLQPELI